jgi:uncharacterized protein
MFVVELAFNDDPARLALRPAHRELLRQLHEEGVVVMAGPFEDESGALLLLNVEDEDAVDKVLDQDPYYSAPGVTITRRQRWSVVVG